MREDSSSADFSVSKRLEDVLRDERIGRYDIDFATQFVYTVACVATVSFPLEIDQASKGGARLR